MTGLQNTLSIAERRRQRQEEEARRKGSSPQVTVSVTALAENPANPRQALPQIEELADSIRETGIAQALTVIPSSVFCEAFPEHLETVSGLPYVVVNGNRRLAAAKVAGLAEVPFLVNTSARTRTEIVILSLVENIQREDLSAIEELEAIEELKAVLGTYAAVAQALGKSEGWVSQRRRLGNLTPDALAAFKGGELNIEEARELGKEKDPAAQTKALAALKAAKASGEPKPARRARAAKKPAVPAQAERQAADPASDRRRAACVLSP